MRVTVAILAILITSAHAEKASTSGPAQQSAVSTTENKKAEFLSHLRVGRFRMNIRTNNPAADLPDSVYVAVRDGRYREAGKILLESGRGGNLDAYEALHILLIPCWSPDLSKHLATRRERDRPAALERAKTLQATPAALEQLDWAFEADAADHAAVRSELCPNSGEDLATRWEEESRKATDGQESKPSPNTQQQVHAPDETRVAHMAADDSQAAAIATAREGNIDALTLLAGIQYGASPPRSIGLSPSERYAWATVTDELITNGCFGTNYFIAWMTTTPTRLGLNLMEMSPADAERAKTRAREMAASETPRIRAATTCERPGQVEATIDTSPR